MSIHVLGGSTTEEKIGKAQLVETLRHSAIPNAELLDNLGLFLTRQTLSRINFMQELYGRILHTHGSIMEFGVRWGDRKSVV